MNNRDEIHEFRRRLHGLRGEIVCDIITRVAALEIAQLDRKLRSCTTIELERLQGEVKAWEKIQKYIYENPDVAPLRTTP